MHVFRLCGLFGDCANKNAHTEVSPAHLGRPPQTGGWETAITGKLGSVPIHVAAGLYEMNPLHRP